MSAKVAMVSTLPTAEWRLRIERENAAELWRFKDAHDLTNEGLARHFGCSVDSILRYLDESRPVPGYIVRELFSWRMAKEAA